MRCATSSIRVSGPDGRSEERQKEQTRVADLLEVSDLGTWFYTRQGIVKAVDGVDFSVAAGETLAIVGESGCGKSTLGFSLLGLTPPTSGEILLMGSSIDIHKSSSWKPFRRDFQIVFQDPYTSLNPRLTVFELLAEPLATHGLVKRHRGIAQVIGAPHPGRCRPAMRPKPPSAKHLVHFSEIQIHHEQRIGELVRPRCVATVPKLPDV